MVRFRASGFAILSPRCLGTVAPLSCLPDAVRRESRELARPRDVDWGRDAGEGPLPFVPTRFPE